MDFITKYVGRTYVTKYLASSDGNNDELNAKQKLNVTRTN